jgi:hypothetical protein
MSGAEKSAATDTLPPTNKRIRVDPGESVVSQLAACRRSTQAEHFDRALEAQRKKDPQPAVVVVSDDDEGPRPGQTKEKRGKEEEVQETEFDPMLDMAWRMSLTSDAPPSLSSLPPASSALGGPPPTIKFVTWNIGDYLLSGMHAPSAAAPRTFTREANRAAVVREVLSHAPDVVALQECCAEEFELHRDYIRTLATVSHCGYIHLFLRRRWADSVRRLWCIEHVGVFATLEVHTHGLVSFGSVHLAPGPQAGEHRVRQLAAAQRSLPRDSPTIIMGDANM